MPVNSLQILPRSAKVRNAKAWRDRYEQHHRDLGLLTLLDEKFAKTSLSEGEAWRRLLVLERLRGKSVAQPEIERFLSAYPEHSGAQFAAARLRLEDGDESGLDLLRNVMRADGNSIKPGAELAHKFLKARGRNEEAAEFGKLWWDRQRLRRRSATRALVVPPARYLSSSVASRGRDPGDQGCPVAGTKAYRRIRRVRGARLYRRSW